MRAQDFDLWGEDVIIHRRMLRSVYRTYDAQSADYFLVPVWVSSAMWQMNWGFRDLLPTGVRQTVETAVFVVGQPLTPSSPLGSHRLQVAPHTPEEPLSHWACFQCL